VLRKARETFDAGDFRWTATVLNYVIFANPDNAEARSLQADTLEQLGYGAENGTWRNFFLTGALELRDGSVGTPVAAGAPDILAALTVDQLFDSLALRVAGPNAWDRNLTIDWNIAGHGVHRSTLSNGVLIHYDVPAAADGADTTFSLSKTHLLQLFGRAVDLGEQLASGAITVEGDPALLAALVGHLDQPDPNVAIVTP